LKTEAHGGFAARPPGHGDQRRIIVPRCWGVGGGSRGPGVGPPALTRGGGSCSWPHRAEGSGSTPGKLGFHPRWRGGGGGAPPNSYGGPAGGSVTPGRTRVPSGSHTGGTWAIGLSGDPKRFKGFLRQPSGGGGWGGAVGGQATNNIRLRVLRGPRTPGFLWHGQVGTAQAAPTRAGASDY